MLKIFNRLQVTVALEEIVNAIIFKLKSGEVGCQEKKKPKTTNTLYLVDNQGMFLTISNTSDRDE